MEDVTRTLAQMAVTVLMPAYNAESTIQIAIRSIMDQTYRNWTLLVIDDGSTDRTASWCEALARKDSRIKCYRCEHRGLCGALNFGLTLIQTKYVARMDADDIAHPSRLTKQMAFIEREPEVKVLGTHGYRMNDKLQRLTGLAEGPTTRAAYEDLLRRSELFFLIHSSVVADRDVILNYGGYAESDFPAEDIALWTRIAQDHVVLSLPEELVGYRISRGGISNSVLWKMILQWARIKSNLQHGTSLTFEEFEACVNANAGLRRRFRRGFLQKSTFRNGAWYLFNGKPVRGIGYLLASTALQPGTAVQRVLRWR